MQPRDIIKPALVVGAGIAVEAGAVLGATTTLNHRDQAHNSLRLRRAPRIILGAIIYPFNDFRSWAAVHRGPHHNVTDADLSNFLALADYADYREANPEIVADHPDLPEHFDNFDPGARRIPLATARAIGSSARSLVSDIYVPPSAYSAEAAAAILDDTKPRYLYEAIHTKNPRQRQIPDGEQRTLEDVRYRLRDPHAGVLHPEGLKGVFRDNPRLYINADQPYNRDGLPDDLQRGPLEEKLAQHRSKMLVGSIAAHILLPAAVSIIRKRKTGPAIKAGLMGGSVIGGVAITLLKGAGLVNSIGHGGKHPREAWKTGVITPDDEGKYATNARTLIGSMITMDEASRQGDHHDHPEWIAFGKKWRLAPYGKALEFLARHGVGMSVGTGFPDLEHRPDLPHEAVVMLQKERVRTMKEQGLLAA